MTTPACLNYPIYQGATFREELERVTVPYSVRQECGGRLVDACTGASVPDADITREDYTGCTARMQLRRDIDDPEVLLELSTANGGIELDGAWLRLLMKMVPIAMEILCVQVSVTMECGPCIQNEM